MDYSITCHAQLSVLRLVIGAFLCLNVPATVRATEGMAGTNTAGADGTTDVAEASALMKCFNEKFSPEPITVTMYLASTPSRSVRMHRIWWSKRQHRLEVTLFTHTDLSRLQSVESQCRGYPGGVIAVAVWLPLVVTEVTQPEHGAPTDLTPEHWKAIQNATGTIEVLFQRMEAASQPADDGTASSGAQPHKTCMLRVMLLTELVASDIMAALMPLNILRNAAMLAATTSMVAMVDADMALNAGMASEVLVNQSRVLQMQRMSTLGRVVWVVPIFDTNDTLPMVERMAVVEAATAGGSGAKATLLYMWHNRMQVFPYGSRGFTLGHGPTDCERWSKSSTDYNITYAEGYEPFFIGPRKMLPAYDSRFRGYFRDKISNTAYVGSQGFKFRVLPDVWMVHRPHEPCVASYKYLWHHDINTVKTPLEKMVPLLNGTWVRARAANNFHSISTYRQAYHSMERGTYQLVLNEPTRHCRAVLPWWR